MIVILLVNIVLMTLIALIAVLGAPGVLVFSCVAGLLFGNICGFVLHMENL